MMNGVFLLLGTNQGNRKKNLENAIHYLKLHDFEIKVKSSLYQTAPWGITQQPNFYNQAINLLTKVSANNLLSILKNIEFEMGRITTEKWGERLIDIDILYYEDQIIENENLIIPHPQIPYRRFTLVPLVEIAPDFIHPILKISQKELLKRCPDQLEVKKVSDDVV